MMIHALAQRGLSPCDMAKQVGVHPRTVRRVLARGGAPALRPKRRGSRLDPYRADIHGLLAEDVWNYATTEIYVDEVQRVLERAEDAVTKI
jgi:lambda repressor-like predicted transcriptional regulator